ncbi:DUF1573 domain-containing protein [bacterium]|nr:DUF1573 domain-containing protein [bacterium]
MVWSCSRHSSASGKFVLLWSAFASLSGLAQAQNKSSAGQVSAGAPAASAEKNSASPVLPVPAANNPVSATTQAPVAASPAKSTPAQQETAPTEKEIAADNLQGQKPLAEFTQMRYDFGDIVRGQKVSFAFEFKNVGSGVLQIRSIHSSCGCVNTKVEPKDVFAPGEKGKLSFEFDSSYFAGNIIRTLTVDTNQARNSAITLTFTANVQEEIHASPALLSVGEVLPEYNKAWLINLSTALRATSSEPETIPAAAEKAGLTSSQLSQLRDTKEVKPIFATSSQPAIAAEIVAPSGKGKDYQLKLTFKGGLPIGPLREKVSIWNTSRHLKELIIPIVGEVVGHVKQNVKYIEFGVVTRPETVKRALTVSSDRKDFQVESVSAELRRSDALEGITIADILKYSTTRGQTGTQVNFELRYPDALSAALQTINASGMFIVRTNDPDYKELRVPFFGVLRQENKR